MHSPRARPRRHPEPGTEILKVRRDTTEESLARRVGATPVAGSRGSAPMSHLLSDEEVVTFIVKGYHVVTPTCDASVHAAVTA